MVKLFQPDSGMYVINTWATWCKPCLQEMPHFRSADSAYASKNIVFIFISFDMIEDSARVAKTIANQHIPGMHYLIDETDMNELINAVDSGWSGTLPATWFISPFYRKPVYHNFGHFYDIETEIKDLIAASNDTHE